jgi:hypothetical protein
MPNPFRFPQGTPSPEEVQDVTAGRSPTGLGGLTLSDVGAFAKRAGSAGMSGAQQALQGLRDPNPSGGLMSQGLGMLGSLGRRLPAAYAAGQGNMAQSQAMMGQVGEQEQAVVQQHKAAQMANALAGLDPSNPGDVAAMAQIAQQYGDTETAIKLMDMLQRGDLERLKLEQKKAEHDLKALAAGRPDLKLVQAEITSYGKTGGDTFKGLVDAQGRIRAGAEQFYNGNPQGFQAAAVGIQKMLDPTSVVRESEYGRSEEFVDLYTKFANVVQKAATGAPTDKVVQDILMLSEQLLREGAAIEQGRWGKEGEKLDRYSIPREDVLGSFLDPNPYLNFGQTESAPAVPAESAPAQTPAPVAPLRVQGPNPETSAAATMSPQEQETAFLEIARQIRQEGIDPNSDEGLRRTAELLSERGF